jgi:hypothetical protein
MSGIGFAHSLFAQTTSIPKGPLSSAQPCVIFKRCRAAGKDSLTTQQGITQPRAARRGERASRDFITPDRRRVTSLFSAKSHTARSALLSRLRARNAQTRVKKRCPGTPARASYARKNVEWCSPDRWQFKTIGENSKQFDEPCNERASRQSGLVLYVNRSLACSSAACAALTRSAANSTCSAI